MAETPLIEFDAAAARRDGASDTEIADFLAGKVGFDIAAARKDGASDTQIIDFLAPQPAAAPKAAEPEPTDERKSGMLKGIAKTVGQQALKLPGGVVETAGSTAEVAALIDKANTRQQLDVFDRIDRGETIKPKPVRGLGYQQDQDLIWANQYASKSPEERAEMRRVAESYLLSKPDMLQRTGADVRKAGTKMQEWAEKTIPLTEEEQGRTSVEVTKLLTMMVPYVAAAVTTGGTGLVGYGTLENLNRTYTEALKQGADPEKAALGAVENGSMQGVLNVVPAAHAAQILQRLPGQVAKGRFVQLLTDAALGSANMLTMTQVGQLAENAVAEKTFDPARPWDKGVGEHLAAPAIAGAILPVGAAVGGRVFRSRTPTPEQSAAKVMEAPTVDDAITTARETLDLSALAEETAALREFGNEGDRRQADVLDLWGGLNRGEIQRDQGGNYFYQSDEGQVHPLRVWDGKERQDTISSALAQAQRAAYDKLGIEVVYFDGVPRDVGFDGAVDPRMPDRLFLSTDPTRNAAMVGAHELTHVLEDTRLPDGTNLGDLLHQQVKEGLTAEGRAEAERLFSTTAPKREAFPDGPEGDSLHADAVTAHYIREMAADIGGEAPKFQTFLPRVVDAVQQRYGADVARDVLQRLMAGIRETMTRLREFFFRPEEGAEYGQPPTTSQHWVTNLEQIHDTLARMYAERYGNTAEKDNIRLLDLADRGRRDRLVKGEDVAAEPAMLRRWLGELDQERRDQAANGPEAQNLQRQIDTILSRVQGDEERLTKSAAGRLEAARTALDAIKNPVGDSPAMARVRAALLPPAPEGPRLLPPPAAVTPPPRPPITPQNVYQPETYGRRLADLTPEPARVDRPHAQPMGPSVAAARERLEATSTAEGGMGRRDMTLDRNQRMSEAWARWEVMHEEVGEPEIRRIVEDSGAAPDRLDEISRYYSRKEGETPRKAFEDAVSRWMDRAERDYIREHNLVDTELEAPRGETPASQPTAANRVEAARPGEAGSRQGGREAGGRGEPPRAAVEPAGAEPRAAQVEIARQVDEARETTDINPTDGQKEAGNYAKGRVSFHGLPFVMENPEGSIRRGKDANGKEWEAKLPADYGYISRTEGADGDHVDAYIGKHHDSQRVWVVDQIDPKTGRFDEHKVMLGTRSVTEARSIYHRAFSDGSGPKRIGAITEMSLDQFKGWLENGDTKSPVGTLKEPAPVQKERAKIEEMKADRWKEIGKNADGQTLYEDARGVRSIVEHGVRRTEPVRLGAPGSGEISVGRDRRDEYKLASDVAMERIAREDAAERAKAESGQDRPEPAKSDQNRPEATPDARMADEVGRLLDEVSVGGVFGRVKIDSGTMQRAAERAYGGTLAEGKFTRDRLYDAIELGVNRYIKAHPERFDPTVDKSTAMRMAEALKRLKEVLPTQTVRAGEKDAYQQFSTPPDYAYAAAWVANLRPTDHVLEPSAGVGGLLVHAMNADVRETTGNEISAKRRGMLEALEPTRITGEDAAQLHNILPDDVRPTVVVMNPPFSRAAERMGGKMVLDEGAKHIEQALQRLEPGGRLVAIVGDSMKPAGTVTEGYSRDRGRGGGQGFRGWWEKIGAEYDVRANVGVDRDIYTKYGTSFPTRFLVIDKNPPSGRPMVTGQVPDAAGLIERLQEVRNDRGNIEQVAREPGREEVAERAGSQRELFGAAGAVGPGEGRGRGAAPAIAEPAAQERPLGDDRDAGGERPGTREPVVREQSEPADRGAAVEPRDATQRSDEPAGSGADRGGDGLRPDGSGEREQPGVTPAPDDVLKTEEAIAKPDDKGLTEAIYEAYRPQRVTIVGAKAHPGALVQSAAMASVLPPRTDYKPRLPQSLVKSGGLSDAQLEAVTYAGHAHSDVMPDGRRRGFFIGDGTGVGKGREIAGILLDNKQQGRTKAVWISEKRQLINDAKRDWNGLGQPAGDILDHGKVKASDAIKGDKGILFTSYDTLKSAEQTKTEAGKVKGRSRVDQIVEWLGPDFDGVIAFDEAHNLGNATDEKGSRGIKKAAQKALAGVELQQRLPNARVVYVSATGATEVSNLAYADRLGLWGEGTPFPTRQDFMGKVSEGGMAAMELVARDMKALGHYIARNLSYDGVEYTRVEHKLTGDQRVTYDKLAEGWQTVLQNFEKALEITGAVEDGKTVNGRARSAAMSAFWGAHQRFFNQIITSMQMPSVLKAVEKDLKEGRQAVLQLVNTMEAAQGRALEKARDKGDDLENLDMTPRDQLMQLIEKSFPVQQMEHYVDDNGNERTRPVVDSQGNPVMNREAVAMREQLLDEIGSIRVPDGPLEILLNHFGPDQVAEVTGRGERVVRKQDDESGQMKSVVEKRGAQSNVAESNDFQAGKKKILVFSEAGGTGRSYHAALGSGSENARRSHYLVQGGWRADKAVQGFGRTHRTSQASAPIFNLVTTDLQGQKRFISSIARRLGQLGALTKGERRTGDQGLFGNRDNLESTEARDALRQFFHEVDRGQVEGVSMRTLEQGMGLKMRDPETGQLAKELPEMPQFLNRVLSLKIDDQNRVFDAFSERLDNVLARAAAAGTLDVGVETYKADKLSKLSEQVVYTDPRSGAETKHVHLSAQNRNYPASFEDTMAGRNKTGGKTPEYFVQNERSGKVFAVTEGGTKTEADGRVIDQLRLTSPLDYQFIESYKVDRDGWRRLTPEEARPLWDEQVAATPEYRKSDLHIITGAVLPIWDRLGGSPKIYRLATDENERMLGRVIPASRVGDTLQRLGAEALKVNQTPGEIADRILQGATARLANDWTIRSRRVAGENRLELIGPSFQHRQELERHGVFSERIASETRWFIPTGKDAAAAIEAITKNRPVTSLSDGTAFSPRITGESGRAYTPEERKAFERVGRAIEPTTLRERIDEARDDIGRKLIRETVDAYVGLKKNDPEGYMAARLANSVAGAQEVFRLYGTLKFDGSTYNYKDLNGGVRGLVRSLGSEAHDFLWWVAAHRAERLKAEDRENLFSSQDIDTLKGLNRGELDQPYALANGRVTRSREAAYADALRRYDVLNKSVLDLVTESGLVDRKVVDALWSDPFYVPFYREAAEQGSTRFAGPTPSFVKQYASKRLKGGSEKLKNDLWDNAFGNWDHMIDAALRNRAAVQILETATRTGAAEKVSLKRYNHEMTNAEKADTTWAMVDGKQEYWRVTDPMVFKAISALETGSKPGLLMDIGRGFARVLRSGVTANPLFATRNLIRDTENSLAVSQISANPIRNLRDGFAHIDVGGRLNDLARAMAARETEGQKLTPEAISAMAGGALMRLGAASDAGIDRTTILDKPGKLRAFGRYLADGYGAYKDVLASGEDVNRLAIYTQLRKQGYSHDFASFSARDLQDFTLRGAAPFVRTIVEVTPFLGSRMQGLYKIGRAAADADKNVALAVGGRVARNMTIRAATVLGAMTVAGLALDAIYQDDPDYRKRTEFDRQTYYWFKIGDAQFRVPKGFELAALSSLATDGIEAFFSKEMTGERLANNFWSSLGTNLQVQAPAIIQPMIDLYTNTRGTGGPIESTSMERLEPQERYGPDTTLIARGLSSAINAGLRTVAPKADGPSPVQIDYLANAYGAWLATNVMGMADTVVRSFSSEPEKPSKDFWAQVTQGLVRTDSAPQSRYVDMLYDQGKKIEQAHATFTNLMKVGRGDEAREFARERREDLLKYPAFAQTKRLEGEINSQIRVITNDPKLSGEQKRVRIMRLNEMKNRAAEGVFNRSP